jgi:uncharacterized Zn finger protein
MSLKSLTRKDIMQLADSSAVFHRGEEYYRSGAIYQFTVSGDHITAKVRGTYGNYTVEVEDVGDQLEWHCTCPYEGDVCKHIVAALLRYLEGDYEAVAPIEPEAPSALEQTLRAMSHQELLGLILKLASEQADVRRLLLANVSISPQTIRQQPRSSRQVTKLKRDIADFFNEMEHRAQYDDDYYDHEYDEREEYRELGSVFEVAKALNPADQIEVFWHVVTCGNDMFEEYPVGTAQIEQAIGLYAEAVSKLEPTDEEKQAYLDSLIEALDWDMCGYGAVTDALKNALDALCTSPQDYHYVIGQLKTNDKPKFKDWIAGYYLKLGDDQNYLRVRQKYLETEAHYLELADYWRQKGDQEKYLATLEAYVSKLPEKRAEPAVFYYPYVPRAASASVLQTLEDHYRHQQDDENLCRILMTKAQYERLTLELYKHIERVSAKLGTWKECQPKLKEVAKAQPKTLAEIHLHEEDWLAAIELARQNARYEDVQVLVAEGVKPEYPQEAIKIYQQLVQRYIDMQSRKYYHTAAGHAARIKTIYESILKDKHAWQQYIDALRQKYPRHRALQEEFERL